MKTHAKKLSLPLTITRPARCLDHGCVLVDKQTGKITIPVPADGFKMDKYPYIGLPDPMTASQFLQLQAKDRFYRIISTAHATSMQQFGFQFAYPCYLQYDGISPSPLTPMPDFARTLLQQYVLNGQLLPDLVVPVNNKLNVTISEELRGYINQYPLREQGMFCEVCRKQTKRTCNNCRTAWYCCREHQSSGWKDHRTWCRAHRVSGTLSTPSSRRNSGDFEASTQPFGNIMAQLEAIDTPKTAVAEITGEKEIVSNEQNGEVPVPHHDVAPQEVKAEVIEQPITITKVEEVAVVEQPITTTKVEDNAREDNAQEDNAREDNAREDNAIVVKEEPISTTSTDSELESPPPRPQKAVTLKDPLPLLYQLRTKLSLLRTSDAGAGFHRNLKIVVRALYSWKFYFCIGKFQPSVKGPTVNIMHAASVAFAYIIRTYHQDIHLIYPLA